MRNPHFSFVACLVLVQATFIASQFSLNQDLESFLNFKIDLDLPPEQRFVETSTHFKDGILTVIDIYMNLLPQFAQDTFGLLEPFIKLHQREHYLEIQGIQSALGVDMQQILLLNYLYELQAFCTSVIARQADGTIIHGRNLDFSFPDQMRAISYIGNFYKNGVHIFDAFMFAGDIGVYTGVKAGAFSVSENDRQSGNTVKGLMENLELIFQGYNEISWITRDALINCDTFECALSYYISTPIIAPGYLILAGTSKYEGAIISRDKFGTAHVEMLSATQWYLAQTNDDHFDGVCQTRCQSANNNIKAVGIEGMSPERLRNDVMLQNPNLNDHSIFSSIMIPSQGLLDAIPVDDDYPEPSR